MTERRLAAILVADVVGYSKLIGSDEAGTLAQLQALRAEVIEPQIAQHAGRLFKAVGDGFLIEFSSAVQAVNCARAIHEANAAGHLPLRIGIHVGDVVVQGEDLMGDGVNVAARIEGIADPGGIAITRAVHEQVRDKLHLAFIDKGEIELKNIARPVQVFVIGGAKAAAKPAALPLPDKPSIAVLPFQNMSGDPEQDYFVDGLVEDIITALSRFKSLFVIARNSSFTYKGKAVDVTQVGRELGVRYVLEGSVRKSGKQVRITAQLAESENGAHLWADRFDGPLDDIFDLQDQVTTSIVGAIAPTLQRAETERVKYKPTESLDAYDCYLRAVASDHRVLTEANSEASEETLRLSYRAIQLDPEYSSAYGIAAFCYYRRFHNRWMADRAQEMAEAQRLARRAADLAHDDALALCRSGFALAFLVDDLEAGRALIDRALAINPNLAVAWAFSGWVRNFLGDTEPAIKHFMISIRQSPRDPDIYLSYQGIAHAYFCSGDYDEASAWIKKALAELPNYAPGLRMAAAADALAGRLERAQKAIRRVRELDPAFRISDMKDRFPSRQPEHLAKFEEGLRKAGSPE